MGVVWGRKIGKTASLARDDGERVTDMRIVAGVRLWF
ncbi:copper resistance protein B [Cupriavidus sp. SK-3]|nr:copper resistance protein B [Cupriavidus sp. SK-3]